MARRAQPMVATMDHNRIRIENGEARVVLCAKIVKGPTAMLGRSVHVPVPLDELRDLVARGVIKLADSQRRTEPTPLDEAREVGSHKGVEFGHGGRIYNARQHGPNWVVNVGTSAPSDSLVRRIFGVTGADRFVWVTANDSASGVIERSGDGWREADQ